MRKSKLLLITNLFPNPVEPNRGIFVAEMLREMKDMAEITVISPVPWFPRIGFLRRFGRWYKFSQIPHRYTIDGQDVVCPKYLAIPKAGFLHSITLFLAVLPYVVKAHRREKFDLINAHWVFPDGVAAYWISRMMKIPSVLSAHGCDINLYLNMPLRKWQIVSALNGIEHITVVSSRQKGTLSAAGINGAKISVIYNGFSDRFTIQDKAEMRSELGLDPSSKIILFVGRLVGVKGFEHLIHAVKKLEQSGRYDYEIVVVGDGDMRREHEGEVARLGLSHKIRFYGEKGRDEIHKWFGACDVLCLPSIVEGCPTVVIEALACGRPVVASAVGEIPHLIGKDNGFLCRPKNEDDLFESLAKALDRDWDQVEIRNSVANMTWRNSARKYVDAYKEALAV